MRALAFCVLLLLPLASLSPQAMALAAAIAPVSEHHHAHDANSSAEHHYCHPDRPADEDGKRCCHLSPLCVLGGDFPVLVIALTDSYACASNDPYTRLLPSRRFRPPPFSLAL